MNFWKIEKSKADASAFVEPLILYAVLFFRFASVSAAPQALPEPAEFSAGAGLAWFVLHTVPSLALVWYLLLRAKSLKEWGVTWPGRKDIIPALASLAAIALVGLGAAAAARHLGALPEFPRLLPPTAIVPWAVLVVFVFGGAYLEESFFRFYLLSKWVKTGNAPRDDGSQDSVSRGLGPHRAVFVSTLMFALCHAYAGPWGFVNAAVSGTALAYIFLRTRSLHGVSIAHGLYNVMVFAIGPAA